jgi:hypothetical protein
VKSARDRAQAEVAWRLAMHRLGLAADDEALRGLPAALRALAVAFGDDGAGATAAETTPRW